MSRPRGDRRSKRQIERNKKKVIDIMEENKLPPVASQQVADAAGIGRTTLHRYLKSLDKATVPNSPAAYAELKAKVLDRVAAMLDEIESGDRDPQEATAFFRGIAEFSKIAGMYAPTKSIVGHQDLNQGIQFEFMEHAYGLTDDWIRANVFSLMDAGPRQSTKPDFSGFVEQAKQLEAKNEDHS